MKGGVSNKIYTFSDALERARKYCAYQERSQQEVRNKLFSFKLTPDEVEQGIALLVEEGFINEERFAVAYARGKFRIKHWGKIKISAALRMRDISPYCIKKALSGISYDEYLKTINRLLEARKPKVNVKDPVKKKFLLAKYVISQGFEPDLVWDQLRAMKN